MTKYEILTFLESEDDASAEVVADHFSLPRSYVYSRLTVLNRQGVISKRKGEDGLLHFGLTKWGKTKLEWLEERDPDNNFDEGANADLENKSIEGNKKMARVKIQYLDGGVYFCPRCDEEYTLTDVIEGSPDSMCPDCDVELEPVEDEEDEDEES